MKVFIVNGQGAVGKDTFEAMVITAANCQNYKVGKCSTIDYVKEVATSFGWSGEKEPTDRKMLSDLKNLLTEWKDLPYKETSEKIRCYQNGGYTAVFVDSREPQDIERFVKEFNATTILVERGVSILYGNAADDNVNNYEYDVIIDNSRGLKELQEEAEIFFETFIKEALNER